MKKVLFFAALIGLAFSMKAQTITASYNNQQLAEGDTITCIDTHDDIHIAPSLHNNGSRDVTCQSLAYTISADNLELYSMCAGVCLAGNLSPEFTIPANGDYDMMYAGIMAENSDIRGEGWFRINTFVVNGNNDSTNFIAHVVYEKNGILTTEVMPAEMVLFPNPATAMVSVEVALPEGMNNTTVEIRNVQGQVVKSIPFAGQNGTVTLDVSALPSGVYTTAIHSGNRLMSVKKLVVR